MLFTVSFDSILKTLTPEEKHTLKELERKVKNKKYGEHFDGNIAKIFEENSDEVKEYVQKFSDTVQEIQKKQAETYSDNIPQLVTDLQLAVRRIIVTFFTWGNLISSLFEDEVVWRYIYTFLDPYLKYLGKKAPEELYKIDDFIGEAVTRKYRISFEELDKDRTQNKFTLMRNGTATNQIMKIPSKKKQQFSLDTITGTAKIRRDNFLVTFEKFSEIQGLRTSTKKLLDELMIKFTEGNGKSLVVNLSLDEHMTIRGLKDEKEARKQVKEDLETLSNMTLTFNQKIDGKPKDFINLKIIGTHGIKNGIISAAFDIGFHELILKYQPMPIPQAFLALNDNRNPNAYLLGRRISLHKNMNYGSKNEDIISVSTLLETCPNVPTKEEVAQKDRMYKQKIIEPFEAGMNALEGTEIFTWEYCHSKGEPLTDEELKNMDYEIFINLLIKITWTNYPEREIKKHETKRKTKK
ncbi:MAG: hypothetical protein IJP96_00040 [Synergistaceae bacterium]|nr:hypothetical protein [Synergistaceae bacterium]